MKDISHHSQRKLDFPNATHFCMTAQLHHGGKVSCAMLVAKPCCGGFRCYCPQPSPSAGADTPVPAEENVCLDLSSSRSQFGMSCYF